MRWRGFIIALVTALSLFASALRAPSLPTSVVVAHMAKLQATDSDADGRDGIVALAKKADAPKTVTKRGASGGPSDGPAAETFPTGLEAAAPYADADHAVTPIFAELRIDPPTRGRARLQVFLN